MAAANMNYRSVVQFEDLYEVLGLPPGESGMRSTLREIEQAYRRKALEVHPDKNPNDPFANSRFQRLQRAFHVLRDESTRRSFDIRLRAELAGHRRGWASAVPEWEDLETLVREAERVRQQRAKEEKLAKERLRELTRRLEELKLRRREEEARTAQAEEAQRFRESVMHMKRPESWARRAEHIALRYQEKNEKRNWHNRMKLFSI